MKHMSYYEQSGFGTVGSNYSGAYGGFDGQGESAELREATPIDGKGGVVPGPLETSGGKEVYDLTPLPTYAPQQAMPAQAAATESSSFPWTPVLVLGGLAAAGAVFIVMKNKQAAT